MDKLLGCSVTTELYAAWSRLLVTELEPLMLTEEARSLLPPSTLVLTEREFYDNHAIAPLALRDSYTLYQVKSGLAGVALLSANELRTLPAHTRTTLHRIQWALNRGQIYDERFVRNVLADFPAQLDRFMPHVFTTPDGPKLALTHELWQSLPAEAQRRWLAAYVAADAPDCRSSRCRRASGHRSPTSTDPRAPALARRAGPRCDPSGRACVGECSRTAATRLLCPGGRSGAEQTGPALVCSPPAGTAAGAAGELAGGSALTLALRSLSAQQPRRKCGGAAGDCFSGCWHPEKVKVPAAA